MTPGIAISVLWADRAAAMTFAEQEQFFVARDGFAEELQALAGRAKNVMLASKLMTVARDVAMAMTQADLRRSRKWIDDALLQARREGLLPE